MLFFVLKANEAIQEPPECPAIAREATCGPTAYPGTVVVVRGNLSVSYVSAVPALPWWALASSAPSWWASVSSAPPWLVSCSVFIHGSPLHVPGTPSLLVPPLLLLSVVGAYGSRSFEGRGGGGNCHSYQLNCTAFPSIPLATHLHAVINHSHLTSIRESSLPVMPIMLPIKHSTHLVSRLQALCLSSHLHAGSLWLCECLPPLHYTPSPREFSSQVTARSAIPSPRESDSQATTRSAVPEPRESNSQATARSAVPSLRESCSQVMAKSAVTPLKGKIRTISFSVYVSV